MTIPRQVPADSMQVLDNFWRDRVAKEEMAGGLRQSLHKPARETWGNLSDYPKDMWALRPEMVHSRGSPRVHAGKAPAPPAAGSVRAAIMPARQCRRRPASCIHTLTRALSTCSERPRASTPANPMATSGHGPAPATTA